MQWKEGRQWQMKQWGMGRAGCWQGGGGGSAWGKKRDKSCIHIAWNGDIHIAHPPPSLPEVPRYIQGLCWIIRNARRICPSARLISVSLSPSIHPSIQGTPTAFLPWTTSAGPWRWTASWTEKTHSTQQDSLSLSRWVAEWEAVVSPVYQKRAIKSM